MKILIVFSLLLTGCASADVRSFFSSKYDCGNGWRAVTKHLCELEVYGY